MAKKLNFNKFSERVNSNILNKKHKIYKHLKNIKNFRCIFYTKWEDCMKIYNERDSPLKIK